MKTVNWKKTDSLLSVESWAAVRVVPDISEVPGRSNIPIRINNLDVNFIVKVENNNVSAYNFKNILGQRFGRLTVIERESNRPRNNCGSLAYWFCLCDCGNKISASGANLRQGQYLSCGCLQKEVIVKLSTIHGQAKRFQETDEYQMWNRAKNRARKIGVRFDLKPSDIVIPEFCPVLGVKLVRSKMKSNFASPSIDRIFPERGYVRGNVRVISQKANTIKNNSTIEELEKVLAYSYGSEIFAYA